MSTAEPPFGERVVEALQLALPLGVAACVLAYPAASVLAARNPGHLPSGLSPTSIATQQTILEGIIVVFAAFVGIVWRHRARLPGLRRSPTAPRPLVKLPAWIATAALGSVVSAWGFDRLHIAVAPGLYGATTPQAIAIFADSILTPEAVGRMLLMTILSALLRRPRAAVVLQALWIAFSTFMLEQRFLHASAVPDALGWRGLAFGLAANLLFGAAYASYGLAGAAATHAAWNAKLLFLRAP